ncbi:hypothetical protein JZU68_09975, partial [bacterium]|nr:hypothetical protein [bacterium]
MKTSKRILVNLLVLIVVSCSCGIQKLSLNRQDNNTNRIRLDGFYYNNTKFQFEHFFLYQNGVVFNGGFCTSYESVSKILDFYNNPSNYNHSIDLPYAWGVYQINDDNILFEWWRSGDGLDYPTVKFSGKVINDTTLVLDYPARAVGRDTFYFHPFKNKP